MSYKIPYLYPGRSVSQNFNKLLKYDHGRKILNWFNKAVVIWLLLTNVCPTFFFIYFLSQYVPYQNFENKWRILAADIIELSPFLEQFYSFKAQMVHHHFVRNGSESNGHFHLRNNVALVLKCWILVYQSPDYMISIFHNERKWWDIIPN